MPKQMALLGQVTACVALQHVAMVQNQWHHVGIGVPPSLIYFSGDWDAHWGYGVLTDGHVSGHGEHFANLPADSSASRSSCMLFCAAIKCIWPMDES